MLNPVAYLSQCALLFLHPHLPPGNHSQVRERELADNMQLLRQQSEIEHKEKETRKLRDQLRKLGLERYEE